jgi:hypothetical protein
MANVDNPHGLKPIFPSGVGGGSQTGAVTKMYMPADYATDAFIGDPVIIVAAGSNDVVVNTVGGGEYQVGTLPECNVVTVGDGNDISGVIVGFEAVTRDSAIYGVASSVRVCNVITDPFQEYLIQADGAVGPLEVGLNAVLIATHSGSTTTGISGMELDTTSDAPEANASNQLVIKRLYNSPDNETNAAHNEVVVRIAIHTDLPFSATAGDGVLGI